MKKRTIWLFVIVALVIGLSLIAEDQPAREICEQSNAHQQYCASYSFPLFFLIESGKFVDRHNGFFSAFAALVVALFTIALWRSTDKLWTHGQEASARQLRAYMTFAHIHLRACDDGSAFKIQIEWVNRGQTPARRSDGFLDWVALEHSLPSDYDFIEEAHEEESGPMVVGPSQSQFSSCDKPMDLSLLRAVEKGDKRVYLWGSVVYTDVFGQKRRTEMAVKLLPKELPRDPRSPQVVFDIRWDALHRHNGMDEDCGKEA